MTARRSLLHRLRRGHRTTAAILLNTLLVLLLLQGALGVVLWARGRYTPAPDLYGSLDDGRMAELYPHRSRADVTRLWQDLIVPFRYEPFTEFQERARTGPFVNVDAAGFRRGADQGPWPPDPHRTNVFVFGGSTTFGYGVADDDTVPSRLQPLLQARDPDVRVYNFGRGYYYSTQERILFERLLAAGHVPAVAVFIDGLNDFCFDADDTMVSPRLAAAIENESRVSFGDWLRGTPLGRALGSVRERVAGGRPGPSPELDDAALGRIIDRYRTNKRLIEAASAAHGVVPIFVWQPVPMYHYDLHAHLFAERGFGVTTRARHGYEVMANTAREHPLGGHFLWLADVQEASHDPLYVDIVHYAPRFSARIAADIDERMGAVVRDAHHGG